MVQWRTLVASAVMLVSPLVLAEETAEQWVQKMLSASRQVSYQGHSVLLSGGKITSLAIYHAPVENEVWERVVHLSGEPAEIVRKGSTITCLHPDSASQLDVRRTPMGKLSALEESAQSISRYYRFNRAANERVAGRAGVRINVEPLDSHRYGYSLWLDEASGVLLKSQTNPASGDPLEVFEFVSVEIGEPLALTLFDPSPNLKVAVAAASGGAESTATATNAGQWEASWLPDGFRQAGGSSAHADKPHFSTRVYTDGLAAFTVFYENSAGSVTETTRAHGATVAVNRLLPDADILITVVGEIPQATAAKVAEGVKALAALP